MYARKPESKLGRPFWLLVILFSFLYVRWQDVVPILGLLRIPGFLTMGFTLWWIIKGQKSVVLSEPILRCFLIFTALAGTSVLFSVNSVSFSIGRNLLLYLLSLVLPLIFVANNWPKTLAFFRSWMAIHCIVAIFAIKNHGRGNGDFLVDENDLSLALTMAIPYPFYIFFMRDNAKKWRALAVMTMLLLIAGILVSFSRGGFLGMATVLISFWFFSKNKIKNLAVAALIVAVLGGVVWSLVPESYIERINSATDPNNSTRVERLHSWQIGWIMWKNNPIFGVGAGNFAWNVEKYERQTDYWIDDVHTKSLAGRQAHSLYFSMLPDMGLVGVAVYATMVFAMFKILLGIVRAESQATRKAVKNSRENAALADTDLVHDAALLARAMICSMIGFFVSGAFISVAYYPHIWLLAGFVIVLRNSLGASTSPQSNQTSRRSTFKKQLPSRL